MQVGRSKGFDPTKLLFMERREESSQYIRSPAVLLAGAIIAQAVKDACLIGRVPVVEEISAIRFLYGEDFEQFCQRLGIGEWHKSSLLREIWLYREGLAGKKG
jgi:hypothetical protein